MNKGDLYLDVTSAACVINVLVPYYYLYTYLCCPNAIHLRNRNIINNVAL